MIGHTKEPWKLQEGFCNVYALSNGESGLTTHIAKANDAQVSGGLIEAEANARRIVDCVNALAGIENPAAFVEAARGMADKADDALQALVGVDRLLHQYGLMQGEDCPAIEPLRAALTALRATLGEDAA